MQFIGKNEILFLHEAAILKYGGAMGICDEGLLESAIAHPLMGFGEIDFYPTLFKKCAALMRSLVGNHPFIDGNKRVGFAAMATVLLRNGYRLNCSADDAEWITLQVAQSLADVAEIEKWIIRFAVRIS